MLVSLLSLTKWIHIHNIYPQKHHKMSVVTTELEFKPLDTLEGNQRNTVMPWWTLKCLWLNFSI